MKATLLFINLCERKYALNTNYYRLRTESQFIIYTTTEHNFWTRKWRLCCLP